MNQTSMFLTTCIKMFSGLILVFILGYEVHAQNVSYNVNSIPISGNWNTAVGGFSLNNTGTGTSNTAVGMSTLTNNTTGDNNVAIGVWSLNSNQTGSNNVAVGNNALNANISGQNNLAIGANALRGSTTGGANTAIGNWALYNTNGDYNLGIGTAALYYNYTGTMNIAIGDFSGVQNGSGGLVNTTAIGYGARVNASNTMQLGNYDVTKVFAGTGTNATLIAGGLQITGGSLAAGKVLTSDAAGNATWQLPSGGGGGGFFINAPIGLGNIINTNLGGVIIGAGITSAPAGYKLYVSDGILTEKVKVAIKNSGDWADYVFEKKYNLMPLLEVEAYVNKNKHLPGIQSADQLVKEGGIDVSQMMSKQMEKIEELTLYLIQLKKENDEIKAKLTALENK